MGLKRLFHFFLPREKDKSKQLDAALQELEERETGQRTKGPKKARDSYDYFDAIQLLGKSFLFIPMRL